MSCCWGGCSCLGSQPLQELLWGDICCPLHLVQIWSGHQWTGLSPTSTATSDGFKLSLSNLPLAKRVSHKQWLISSAGDHVVLNPRAPLINQCSQGQQRPPYKEATGVAALFSAQPHHKPLLPASYEALQCAWPFHNFWRRKGLFPPTLHLPLFSTLPTCLCSTEHSESSRDHPVPMVTSLF